MISGENAGSFYESRVEKYKESRQNIIDGNINCIPNPFPKFRSIFPGIEQERYYLVTGNEKSGKCFGKGTKVLMYDGSIKNVEDINIGDVLLGPDSKPRNVIETHSGVSDMYRVNQNKGGKEFTVNGAHILHLSYRNAISELSVDDYLKSSKTFKRKSYQIQAPITEFGETVNPTIDPYFYGIWLGDGDTSEINITNSDEEVKSYLVEFASRNKLKINYRPNNKFLFSQDTLLVGTKVDPEDGTVFHFKDLNTASNVDKNLACYISRATKTGKTVNGYTWKWDSIRGSYRKMFKEFTGFQKKRINPEVFMYKTSHRLEFLAGIIDSDGHYNISDTKNSYSIVNKSKSLLEDIQRIAWSLGLRAVIANKWNKEYDRYYYEITITGNNCKLLPIRVERKKYVPYNTTKMYRNFTIKPIGKGEYFGFEVDGDHLFLLDDYTIVHNSQVSDYLFFIHPLMYAYENPDKLKVKVLYFSLEMSKPVKFDQLICHWLYVHTQGRVRVSTKKLNSLSEPLDPSVLTILESDEFKDFFNFLEENTMFFDGVSNPTGIYSKCKKFAESRGSYTYRDMDWEDNVTKKVTKRRVIDTFVKDNKEEYWIVITDHLSLLSTESGMDLRNTIDKFSSNYCSQLRNRYGFTIVNIQQQSATSQDNESFKLDRLMPHPGNLAESKSTKNDLNVMFGIFAPIRFKKRLFEGYNIDVFKDNIRFLELILDRNGISGIMCPLYFDGAVNYFAELPPPDGNIEVFENMAINAQNNRI